MSGNIDKCPDLETSYGGSELFEKVVNPPIKSNQKDINWTFEGNNSTEYNYTLKIGDENTTFTYEKNTSKNCPFMCNSSDDLCQKLER